MTKFNKIIIVVGAVVLIGAIVGVLYGVLHHKENGLMRICWNSNGYAMYNTESSCPEFKWNRNQMPLFVAGNQSKNLSLAISWVNDEIGCEVLKYDGLYSSRTDVHVSENVPIDPNNSVRGGFTSHRKLFNNKVIVDVSIYSIAQEENVQLRTLVHEFGHVLGLDHDTAENSVMYFNNSSSTDEGYYKLIRFTDYDRELLNNLYCH